MAGTSPAMTDALLVRRRVGLGGGLAVARQAAELVVLRETFWRDAARVRPVAAPVLELFHRQREAATRRIGPGQAGTCRERRHIREALFLVALQAHAPPAPHLGYLVEREDDHLAVGADRRREFAVDRGHRGRFVRRLEVEHLLALAGGAEALV